MTSSCAKKDRDLEHPLVLRNRARNHEVRNLLRLRAVRWPMKVKIMVL